ncbi:MAG: FHA domain-containing protein [Chloroflexota bacterium]
MVATQLYIGRIPDTAARRCALRERALEILLQLRQARQPAPCTVLLDFSAGDGPVAGSIDLLLLRPNALIVGALRAYPGPIEALPGAVWRHIDDGTPIVDVAGMAPLEVVRAQRDAVVTLLRRPDQAWSLPPDARVLGALICVPTTHPQARISLDVDDHRCGLKVFGLDELPGVAAMVNSGVSLSPETMRTIAADLLGGRLWFDGARTLFDLAPPRFRLRLLDGERAGQVVLLGEGETVIGRRRNPRRFERRLSIVGDDLVSNDNAVLSYGDDDVVMLRDTSKNGTWVFAGGSEHHLRGGERPIAPGTTLRMGMTRMRLERNE